MSRGVFNSNNKVGDVIYLQKSGSTSSFDPLFNFSGLDPSRVSWRLDNGSDIIQIAGNSITYTGFTSDTSIRSIQIRGNKFTNANNIQMNNDNLYGDIDFSLLGSGDKTFYLWDNSNLTGITNPYVTGITSAYNVSSCNITGNLDMTPINGDITSFQVQFNPNLTGITHNTASTVTGSYYAYTCDLTGILNIPFSTPQSFRVDNNDKLSGITHVLSTNVMSSYNADRCDLIGNHDMSMFTNLGGDFRIYSNSNLTGITHTASTQLFTIYYAYGCNLTGNHDISMFPNLGGTFWVGNNPNLTGVTHTASTQVFNHYNVSHSSPSTNIGLIGNHDISMFPNLGGNFRLGNNDRLTGITHTATTQVFTWYYAYGCDLTGNHDMSMLTGLGGDFRIYSNSGLTSVTHTASTQLFSNYNVNNCNISGVHDMSMFTGLGGNFNMSGNALLTGVTHTASTKVFTNYYINNCDIKPTHDFSMLSSLGGNIRVDNNIELVDIINPPSTEDITYYWAGNCNLNYIDFYPLSGASISDIQLQDNTMVVGDVNHILVDFYTLNNTYFQPGWSGVTLDELHEQIEDFEEESFSTVFKNIMDEYDKSIKSKAKMDSFLVQRLETVLELSVSNEDSKLNGGLSFLASSGSVAPFIGLFGTVWGIMHSFQAIAIAQNTNLAVVAPGIAEALFVTALGLFVAIPSTAFYNLITARIDSYLSEVENFGKDLVNIISRQMS